MLDDSSIERTAARLWKEREARERSINETLLGLEYERLHAPPEDPEKREDYEQRRSWFIDSAKRPEWARTVENVGYSIMRDPAAVFGGDAYEAVKASQEGAEYDFSPSQREITRSTGRMLRILATGGVAGALGTGAPGVLTAAAEGAMGRQRAFREGASEAEATMVGAGRAMEGWMGTALGGAMASRQALANMAKAYLRPTAVAAGAAGVGGLLAAGAEPESHFAVAGRGLWQAANARFMGVPGLIAQEMMGEQEYQNIVAPRNVVDAIVSSAAATWGIISGPYRALGAAYTPYSQKSLASGLKFFGKSQEWLKGSSAGVKWARAYASGLNRFMAFNTAQMINASLSGQDIDEPQGMFTRRINNAIRSIAYVAVDIPQLGIAGKGDFFGRMVEHADKLGPLKAKTLAFITRLGANMGADLMFQRDILEQGPEAWVPALIWNLYYAYMPLEMGLTETAQYGPRGVGFGRMAVGHATRGKMLKMIDGISKHVGDTPEEQREARDFLVEQAEKGEAMEPGKPLPGQPVGLDAALDAASKVETPGAKRQPKAEPEVEERGAPIPEIPATARAAAEAAGIRVDEEEIAVPKEPTLPKDLAGARPGYNIGTDRYRPKFDSDIDKAMFITAQSRKSKRDSDYRAFLKRVGYSDEQINEWGPKVRSRIKEIAKASDPGTIAIPRITPGAGKAEVRERRGGSLNESFAETEDRTSPPVADVPEEARQEIPKVMDDFLKEHGPEAREARMREDLKAEGFSEDEIQARVDAAEALAKNESELIRIGGAEIRRGDVPEGLRQVLEEIELADMPSHRKVARALSWALQAIGAEGIDDFVKRGGELSDDLEAPLKGVPNLDILSVKGKPEAKVIGALVSAYVRSVVRTVDPESDGDYKKLKHVINQLARVSLGDAFELAGWATTKYPAESKQQKAMADVATKLGNDLAADLGKDDPARKPEKITWLFCGAPLFGLGKYAEPTPQQKQELEKIPGTLDSDELRANPFLYMLVGSDDFGQLRAPVSPGYEISRTDKMLVSIYRRYARWLALKGQWEGDGVTNKHSEQAWKEFVLLTMARARKALGFSFDPSKAKSPDLRGLYDEDVVRMAGIFSRDLSWYRENPEGRPVEELVADLRARLEFIGGTYKPKGKALEDPVADRNALVKHLGNIEHPTMKKGVLSTLAKGVLRRLIATGRFAEALVAIGKPFGQPVDMEGFAGATTGSMELLKVMAPYRGMSDETIAEQAEKWWPKLFKAWQELVRTQVEDGVSIEEQPHKGEPEQNLALALLQGTLGEATGDTGERIVRGEIVTAWPRHKEDFYAMYASAQMGPKVIVDPKTGRKKQVKVARSAISVLDDGEIKYAGTGDYVFDERVRQTWPDMPPHLVVGTDVGGDSWILGGGCPAGRDWGATVRHVRDHAFSSLAKLAQWGLFLDRVPLGESQRQWVMDEAGAETRRDWYARLSLVRKIAEMERIPPDDTSDHGRRMLQMKKDLELYLQDPSTETRKGLRAHGQEFNADELRAIEDFAGRLHGFTSGTDPESMRAALAKMLELRTQGEQIMEPTIRKANEERQAKAIKAQREYQRKMTERGGKKTFGMRVKDWLARASTAPKYFAWLEQKTGLPFLEGYYNLFEADRRATLLFQEAYKKIVDGEFADDLKVDPLERGDDSELGAMLFEWAGGANVPAARWARAPGEFTPNEDVRQEMIRQLGGDDSARRRVDEGIAVFRRWLQFNETKMREVLRRTTLGLYARGVLGPEAQEQTFKGISKEDMELGKRAWWSWHEGGGDTQMRQWLEKHPEFGYKLFYLPMGGDEFAALRQLELIQANGGDPTLLSKTHFMTSRMSDEERLAMLKEQIYPKNKFKGVNWISLIRNNMTSLFRVQQIDEGLATMRGLLNQAQRGVELEHRGFTKQRIPLLEQRDGQYITHWLINIRHGALGFYGGLASSMRVGMKYMWATSFMNMWFPVRNLFQNVGLLFQNFPVTKAWAGVAKTALDAMKGELPTWSEEGHRRRFESYIKQEHGIREQYFPEGTTPFQRKADSFILLGAKLFQMSDAFNRAVGYNTSVNITRRAWAEYAASDRTRGDYNKFLHSTGANTRMDAEINKIDQLLSRSLEGNTKEAEQARTELEYKIASLVVADTHWLYGMAGREMIMQTPASFFARPMSVWPLQLSRRLGESVWNTFGSGKTTQQRVAGLRTLTGFAINAWIANYLLQVLTGKKGTYGVGATVWQIGGMPLAVIGKWGDTAQQFVRAMPAVGRYTANKIAVSMGKDIPDPLIQAEMEDALNAFGGKASAATMPMLGAAMNAYEGFTGTTDQTLLRIWKSRFGREWDPSEKVFVNRSVGEAIQHIFFGGKDKVKHAEIAARYLRYLLSDKGDPSLIKKLMADVGGYSPEELAAAARLIPRTARKHRFRFTKDPSDVWRVFSDQMRKELREMMAEKVSGRRRPRKRYERRGHDYYLTRR